MFALGRWSNIIMAKPKADLLTKVVELCRAHGFVLESIIEQNGVTTRVYEYGPLGAEMRRALRERWWNFMVTAREDVVGVESSVLRRLSQWKNNDKGGVSSSKLDTNQASISPEIERMTLNYFFTNDNEKMYLIDSWERQRLRWWKSMANFSRKFSSSAPTGEDVINARDIQVSFPWGPQTVETIRQRADLDGCPVRDWQLRHGDGHSVEVIEMTTFLDEALLVYLLDAYEETERPTSTGQLKQRKVMRIHASLAPIKVAVVTPAETQRTEVYQVGRYLAQELRKAGMNTTFINSIADLEEQYAQQDEIGVPFVVTILEESFSNGIVSLRNRDTSLQEQLHIDDVLQTLRIYLKL